MALDDFGPVPIARFKMDSKPMYEALASGRRVLISKRGEVVVRIEPHTRLRRDLVALYKRPGPSVLPELTATAINQSSPSEFINDAIERGVPCFVSNNHVLYGVLHAVSHEQLERAAPSPEDLADVGRRVRAFLSDRPSATAAEIADATASFARQSEARTARELRSRHVPQIWKGGNLNGSWNGHAGNDDVRGAGIPVADPREHVWWQSPQHQAEVHLTDARNAADREGAVAAYHLAADLGVVEAMLELGHLAADDGDAETARVWFETAIGDTDDVVPVVHSMGMMGVPDKVRRAGA